MRRWKLSASARFWSKVALPDENGCMLWMAARGKHGYGIFSLNCVMGLSHRMSLMLTEGDPGDGLQAAHSCRNKHCVAPDHLRWATPAENAADRKRDGTEAQGERHGGALLKEEQVLAIRERVGRGETQKSLAVEFGVSGIAISDVVNRRRWGWLEREAS